MFSFHPNKMKGMSLVEILVASAIISVTLVVLVNSFTLVLRYAHQNTRQLKADMLGEEGGEALVFLRDSSWSSNIAALTNGTTYRLYWNGSLWVATTSSFWVDGKYDRTFVLSSVSRDASFNVVSSGGSVDSGSRKATIRVAWKEGSATTTKTTEIYLFNIFNN